MTRLRLLALDEISPDSARKVVVDGFKIAVIRVGDDIYAIDDTCSHADYSLAEGEIDCDDRTIECFKHGAAFSLETGEPLNLPATRPVAVYETTIEDGVVYAVPHQD